MLSIEYRSAILRYTPGAIAKETPVTEEKVREYAIKKLDFGYTNVAIDFGYWFACKLMPDRKGLRSMIDIIDMIASLILLGNPEAKIISTLVNLQKFVADAKNFIKSVNLFFDFPQKTVKNISDTAKAIQGDPSKQAGGDILPRVEMVVLQETRRHLDGLSSLCSNLLGFLKMLSRIGSSIPAFVMHPLTIADHFLTLATSVPSLAVKIAKFAKDCFETEEKSKVDLKDREITTITNPEEVHALAALKFNQNHKIQLLWQMVNKTALIAFAVFCLISIFAPAIALPVYLIPVSLAVYCVTSLMAQYVKQQGCRSWKEILKCYAKEDKELTLEFVEKQRAAAPAA